MGLDAIARTSLSHEVLACPKQSGGRRTDFLVTCVWHGELNFLIWEYGAHGSAGRLLLPYATFLLATSHGCVHRAARELETAMSALNVYTILLHNTTLICVHADGRMVGYTRTVHSSHLGRGETWHGSAILHRRQARRQWTDALWITTSNWLVVFFRWLSG
jgi:hypothetical protein